MTGYFITASGTGIGKTLVTCALAHQLRARGKRLRAIKPVVSGYDSAAPEMSDTGMLLQAQGLPLSATEIDSTSPWRFTAPISPDMAAEDEGRAIPFAEMVAFCQSFREDYLLVEGVGGALVPLDDRHTVLDWMWALGFPVILVTGSYLGSISHTLASTRAVLSAGLRLAAVIISESENPPVPLARMQAALTRFLPGGTPVTGIARLDSSPGLWKYVPDLTQFLL